MLLRLLFLGTIALLVGCSPGPPPTIGPAPASSASTAPIHQTPAPGAPTQPPTPTLEPLPPVRAEIGFTAPDFIVNRLDNGQQLRLSDLRGKPVWLNFWATWCPNCREEMRAMQQVHDQYSHTPLIMVGVNYGEDPNTVRRFLDADNYTWIFGLDPDKAIAGRYRVTGMPTHVFIGPDGVIWGIAVGELNHHQMEEYIDSLIY